MTAICPICPTCGCSLVRMGISTAVAARVEHRGEELLFCCQRCAEVFGGDQDRQRPVELLERLAG